MQLFAIARQFRSIERRFVVVAQQVFVLVSVIGLECRGKQPFRQNDARPESLAVGAMPALTNASKAVAGSDDPGIRDRALEVLTKIFEDRGILRRNIREIIERLVNSG